MLTPGLIVKLEIAPINRNTDPMWSQALLKMKRELRSRMEREIGELQKIIIQNDEDDFFQDLDVQRLQSRVHMASFQYNKSYLHWPGEAEPPRDPIGRSWIYIVWTRCKRHM